MLTNFKKEKKPPPPPPPAPLSPVGFLVGFFSVGFHFGVDERCQINGP